MKFFEEFRQCCLTGRIIRELCQGQSGMTMIETVTAIAILGIVGVAALSGLASSVIGGGVVVDHGSIMTIAQRQLEYVKTLPYQSAPSTYAVLEIPAPYQVTCESWPLSDGNMQKIVVTVLKDNRTLLQIEDIKVNR